MCRRLLPFTERQRIAGKVSITIERGGEREKHGLYFLVRIKVKVVRVRPCPTRACASYRGK